jgi:uncharacterized membrane protein YfcA
MPAIAIVLCGISLGAAFGLTGVGSIFATPLLVYAVGLPPHQAVCVSMVAVNLLALISSIQGLKAREVAIGDGLCLGVPGVLGAPLGAWMGGFLSARTLMMIFGVFVAVLALQMLLPRQAKAPTPGMEESRGARSTLLAAAGLITGILAGLLGAGGVLIVPALVLVGGLAIHRAIATSLPVIYAISVAAVLSHLLTGQTVPLQVTTWFVAGAILGLAVGRSLGERLSGPPLQKVFGSAMVAVAAFILVQTLA